MLVTSTASGQHSCCGYLRDRALGSAGGGGGGLIALVGLGLLGYFLYSSFLGGDDGDEGYGATVLPASSTPPFSH